MPEIQGVAFVETEDLAPQALPSGPAGGNSLYYAHPGDGTWAAAPLAAAADTISGTFTAESVSVYVQTAAVEVAISSDGASFGGWIVLLPGVHSFPIATEAIRVRRADDAIAAEYQIVGTA